MDASKIIRKIVGLFLVFTLVMQAVPVMAQTTTKKTTKTTTTYTTKKVKMSTKAKRTYSSVGKSTTTYKKTMNGNTTVKVTTTKTPTTKYVKGSYYKTVKTKIVTKTETTVKTISGTTSNNSTNQSVSSKKEVQLSSTVRSKVGSAIADAYTTLGFKVYIDSNSRVTGYYSTRDRSITLRNNDDTIYHELGHFLSFVSGNTAETDAFKKIYDSEKNKYTKYNKAYVTSSPGEFFAECYRLYILNPSYLKTNMPKTYKTITEAKAKVTTSWVEKVKNAYSIIWR